MFIVIIGLASDSPYASYILIPIVSKNLATLISRGAPPDIKPLNFPPNFRFSSLNNIFESALLFIILAIAYLKLCIYFCSVLCTCTVLSADK